MNFKINISPHGTLAIYEQIEEMLKGFYEGGGTWSLFACRHLVCRSVRKQPVACCLIAPLLPQLISF